MSYQNGYVVCVVVNGRVMDEHNKTVYLPEGQEYGLRLRNKNDVDAVAQIFIDGENVSQGGYIVKAHKSVDIFRHGHVDKAFKLVSHLRKQAQEEGKDELRSNSGVVEVRWFKERPKQTIKYSSLIRDEWPTPWVGYSKSISSRGMFSCSTVNAQNEPEHLTSGLMFNACQPGVTVEGKETGQKFIEQHIDLEANYVSVFLYLKLLRGIKSNSIMVDDVEVKSISYCSNCGQKVGSSANYCSVCGRPIGVE